MTCIKSGFQGPKVTNIRQVITGMGGCGKTSLAIQYAYAHQEEYQLIAFFPAENCENFDLKLIDLADHLGLSGEKPTQKLLKLKDWLAENEDWLLIADNADEKDAIKHVLDSLPNPSSGHLLLTSRNAKPINIDNIIPLSDFKPEDSLSFLLSRTKSNQVSDEIKNSAAILANELGHLPLALEQAAALIYQTGMSFNGYLQEYHSQSAKLLSEGTEYSQLENPQTKHVAVTWNMNLQAIAEKKPILRDFLSLVAFLSPELIPFELITQGLSHSENESYGAYSSNDSIKRLFSPLHDYSLIKLEDDIGFQIHRLVQEVICLNIPEQQRVKYQERCIEALLVSGPLPDYMHAWNKNLYIHASTFKDYPMTLSSARVLSTCALYATKTLNDREAAEILWKKAQKIYETLSDPLSLAEFLNNRGDCCVYFGQIEEGILFLEAALQIKENSGAEPLNTAITLNNLGHCYHHIGMRDNQDAPFHTVIKYINQALDYRKLAVEIGIPSSYKDIVLKEIAQSQNNLGSAYMQLRQYPQAEKELLAAKESYELAYGNKHPEVATVYHQLGILYYKMNDPKLAENYYQAALKIRQNQLVEPHAHIGSSYSCLGYIYLDKNELSYAEELYVKALNNLLPTLGLDHYGTEETLSPNNSREPGIKIDVRLKVA